MSIIAAALVHYSVTLGLGQHTQVVLAKYGPERLAKTAYWQILGYRMMPNSTSTRDTNGLIKKQHLISVRAMAIMRQFLFANLPSCTGAFSFPNISIAILINNLLDPNPWRVRGLYAMVTLQVVLAIISIFIVFLQCSPPETLWNGQKGKCWDPSVLNNYSYFLSAYTTLTDVVLAVVPISAFWNLQMRRSTKIGLSIMMGLTLLSAIVTVVKATYLHLFADQTDHCTFYCFPIK